MKVADITDVLEGFRSGEHVIFIGDEAHPSASYLVLSAEKATPASIAFMTRHGTGHLCLALASERMEALRIPQTPFDYNDASFFRSGKLPDDESVTGRAAEERAAAIRAFTDSSTRPDEIEIPRHIVPLRAMRGGVVACATPIEAAVDLARLSGLRAVSVVCRLSTEKEDGSAAGRLEAFSLHHGVKVISIASLIAYRRRNAHAKLICLPSPVRLPTRYGDFRAQVYEDPLTGVHHMAAILGDIDDGRPVLTRMHSECLTGDVLGSLRCDCGPQLERAFEQIAAAGRGVLLYLRQEGRGIGLYHKLQTYALQERGLDTVEANERLGFPADLRDYGLAAQMLRDLGVRQLRLLTNNPKKIESLKSYGLQVVERVPLVVAASAENRLYLRTKQKKLGHLLNQDMSLDR